MRRKVSTDPELRESLLRIKLIVSDVDGVLTDGSITLDSNEGEIKTFCAKDAPRIAAGRKFGVGFVMVSGRDSPAVHARAKDLGVEFICKKQIPGVEEFWSHLREKYDVAPEEVLYIGDDWNDLPYMASAGVAVTPKDGRPENRSAADIVTATSGGRGVVSEIIERLLRVQDKWQAAIDAASKIP